MPSLPLLAELQSILSPSEIITDPSVIASFTTDWTGRFTGHASFVVRPNSTASLSRALSRANSHGVRVQIQGGNTGLVGGSVPPLHSEVDVIIVSTTGLVDVAELDELAGTIVVSAGTTLGNAQQIARTHGWDIGVDIAARDTATVGGMVATNAGGIRVCAFGMMRQNITGIEAVLPDGTIISNLSKPIKNNTGFNILDLLVGSEGTLAVVTKVRLRLVRPITRSNLVFIPLASISLAVDITKLIQQSNANLFAAEVVDHHTLELVYERAGLRKLWVTTPNFALLLEVNAVPDSINLPNDALLADTAKDKAMLWQYREHASDCWTQSGHVHKLDVSVDPGTVDRLATAVASLLAAEPSVKLGGFFGHIADGNLHVEFIGPAMEDFRVDAQILHLVAEFGGSISAEHGIGRAKSDYLHLAHDPSTIATMKNVRDLIDPKHTLNPGVLFG